MCAHTHAHKHHMHTHTHTHICTRTHLHTHTHTRTPSHTHTHKRACFIEDALLPLGWAKIAHRCPMNLHRDKRLARSKSRQGVPKRHRMGKTLQRHCKDTAKTLRRIICAKRAFILQTRDTLTSLQHTATHGNTRQNCNTVQHSATNSHTGQAHLTTTPSHILFNARARGLSHIGRPRSS